MIDSHSSKKSSNILLIPFLIMIASGFVFSINHAKGIALTVRDQITSVLRGETAFSEIPVKFDNYYNSLYSSQSWSLDVFSIVHRILGKHEARNFEVLKAKDGALYLHGSEEETDLKDLQIMADECKILFDATVEYGGHFIYVQAPFKNVGQALDLTYYSSDTTEENESNLVDLIRSKNIPVLDLREYRECIEYYNTDHHWTTRAAFNASKIITDKIESIYNIEFKEHDHNSNIDNYTPVTYKNSFLGSIGIKVGPYFGGKDSFTIYNPDFNTDFTLEHYVNNELQFQYAGTFWDAFINQDILENTDYYNKYDSNLHGAYVETVIKNNCAKNSFKGLLITHSYGRPMAQYMCFDYSELIYLDPQKGRFNDNLAEYIHEYKPDVVIYMYNDIVNVGDGNWLKQ